MNDLKQLTHPMIHYLLAIHELKEELGYVRATDIAKKLSRTKGSVSIALSKMKEQQLVLEDENRFLNLTEKAHLYVHQIITSKRLFFYFLRDYLGISEKNAEQDSCLIEHLVSRETLETMFQFIKEEINLDPPLSFPKNKSALASAFKDITTFEHFIGP